MKINHPIAAIMVACILLSSSTFAAFIDIQVTRPQESASSTNLSDGPANGISGSWTPCDNRNDNEKLNADRLNLSLTIINESNLVTEQGTYDTYVIFSSLQGEKYFFIKELSTIPDLSNPFLGEQQVSIPTIRTIDLDMTQPNAFQSAQGDLTSCKTFEASCTTFDGDKGYLEEGICYPTSSIADYLRCEDDLDEEPLGYLIKATAEFEQGDAFLAANDPIWEKSSSYTENFEDFFGDTALAFDDFALSQGTWQIVAILADRSVFNIQDTSTWHKWDVENILVGNPWSTDSCK